MLFQACLAGGAIVAGLLYRVPELFAERDAVAQGYIVAPEPQAATDNVSEPDKPAGDAAAANELASEESKRDLTAVRSGPLLQCSTNITTSCASALKKSHHSRAKRVHWQTTLGNSQEQLITIE